MLSVDASFILLGSAIVMGSILGWRRYHTALNPLTYMSIVNFGLHSLLSGLVCYSLLEIKPYTSDALGKTALITLVNYVGIAVPYLFKRTLLLGFYGKAIKFIGLESPQIAKKHNPFKFIGLLIGVFASFLALAFIGGGGMRWITDTREAYIQNRAGAGQFYLGMQWFVMSALLYYLWSRRPKKGLHIIILIIIFFSITYFSGSKGNILSVGLIMVVYFNYYIRPILTKEYIFLVFLFAFFFSYLLLVQGSNLNIFMYFGDYFNTTAWFISRFEEFKFNYGSARLGELWFYVPRGLYQDKPYEYGVLMINQVLFPNMAEIGNTPGFLSWTLSYLDFGIIGVFIDGILISMWQRAVYEYYLNHRESFFSFLFMVQFTLFPLLPAATIVITIALALGLSFYFRLVLVTGKKQRCLVS